MHMIEAYGTQAICQARRPAGRRDALCCVPACPPYIPHQESGAPPVLAPFIPALTSLERHNAGREGTLEGTPYAWSRSRNPRTPRP
jgi:hypothetical protein